MVCLSPFHISALKKEENQSLILIRKSRQPFLDHNGFRCYPILDLAVLRPLSFCLASEDMWVHWCWTGDPDNADDLLHPFWSRFSGTAKGHMLIASSWLCSLPPLGYTVYRNGRILLAILPKEHCCLLVIRKEKVGRSFRKSQPENLSCKQKSLPRFLPNLIWDSVFEMVPVFQKESRSGNIKHYTNSGLKIIICDHHSTEWSW